MDFPRFLPSPASGSVPFVGTGGQLTQDNANFFYSASVLNFPNAKLSGATPYLEFNKTGAGAQRWQIRAGSAGNSNLDIYDVTNSLTRLLVTNDGEVRIGSATNIVGNSSRLWVFGGPAGANVDIMGDGTIVGGDQAVLELEGSDYAANFRSTRFSFSGVNAIGTVMGISLVNMGQLCFQQNATALIRTDNTTPMIFAVDNTERLRLTTTGGTVAGTLVATVAFTPYGLATHSTVQLSMQDLADAIAADRKDFTKNFLLMGV